MGETMVVFFDIRSLGRLWARNLRKREGEGQEACGP